MNGREKERDGERERERERERDGDGERKRERGGGGGGGCKEVCCPSLTVRFLLQVSSLKITCVDENVPYGENQIMVLSVFP